MSPSSNNSGTTRISKDLKHAAVRMSKVLPVSTVALLLNISGETVRRVVKLFDETGDVLPPPTGNKRGRPPVLDAEDLKYLEAVVEQKNNRYIDEYLSLMQDATGKTFSMSTLYRSLSHLGITNKSLSRAAEERSMLLRTYYAIQISQYESWQLVFTDESYIDKRNTSRLTGWSRQGTRACTSAPFVRGRRYSILPALSLDGILDVVVLEGAVNSMVFETFVEGLCDVMSPFPEKNSVLVLDNVKFHHSHRVAEILEARGIHIVYLPPYSPDHNPIETAFSCTKAWIRRNNRLVRDAMEAQDPEEGSTMLSLAVTESCTAEKARAWFRDCGYE